MSQRGASLAQGFDAAAAPPRAAPVRTGCGARRFLYWNNETENHDKINHKLVILDKSQVICQLNPIVQHVGTVMLEENSEEKASEHMMRMVAEIVSAYVSYNSIASNELPDLIRTVHQSLAGTQKMPEPENEAVPKPAVPIRRSVQADHIVCLEDGRKLKMLKRYLRTRYDMTPDDYRTKWSLPADYPMVAPNYSNQRSKFAKKIGLGRRRGAAD